MQKLKNTHVLFSFYFDNNAQVQEAHTQSEGYIKIYLCLCLYLCLYNPWGGTINDST